VATGLAVVIVLASWFESDRVFLFWKLRAIPPGVWSQMVSDLEKFGARYAQGGDYHSFNRMELPESLYQLGSRFDCRGGTAQVVNYPDYSGIIVTAMFGYKPRSWGLYIGPKRGCPLSVHIPVGQNAYFFFGYHG